MISLMRQRAVLLVAVLVVAGCAPPPTKIQFNNRMADANKKMLAQGIAFSKALVPDPSKGFSPADVDLNLLKAARDNMKKLLKDYRDKYEDPTEPTNSSQAGNLKEAYQKYLEAQDKILKKADEIIDTLENRKLGDGDKKKKIDDLRADVRKIEAEAYDKLSKAQESYTKAHNFKQVAKMDK